MSKIIRGLRTEEDSRFNRFFSFIQQEAKKLGKIYFFDTEQSGNIELEDMDISDLSGWLLPQKDADEFEKDYLNWKEWESGKWDNFYTFAEYYREDGKVKIDFNQY